jgi:hypothetical protein
MDIDAPDLAAYYFQYKLTVYDNLFVGIVYGEERAARHCYSSFSTTVLFPHRHLYGTLRYLGLHPPVRFICAFNGRTMHADNTTAFRSKPGFTSSPPRVFMFGITTFMFILGVIAMVLETALGFQQMQLFLDPTSGNVWSSNRTNVIIAVGATITRMMVRLRDVFMPSA